MKTFFKLFGLFLTSLILISFSIGAIGQDLKNTSCFVQSSSQYESMYLKALDVYKQKLNPVLITGNSKYLNTTNDYQFLLDTVYLYTVSDNPTRFIYTYSENNFRISTITQVVVNGDWEYSTYEAASFDVAGNKLTSLWRRWEDGSFVNVSKDTYTYNTNGNMLSSLREVWENGNWISSRRGTYVYNTADNLLSYLDERWNDSNWVNFSFELYTYDELAHLLTSVGSLWVGNVWVTDYQSSYTYDVNGNLIFGITEQWQDGEWVNYYRETYTYSSANNRLTLIDEFWETDTWVNSQYTQYSYDDLGFLTQTIEQIWMTDTWLNNRKEFFVYHTYGGYETILLETWDGNAWVNSSMTQNNYDEYGNSVDVQFFDWVNDNWEHTEDGLLRLFFNYSTEIELYTGYFIEASYSSVIVGVDELTLQKENSISCFPNPAISSTTIKVELQHENNCSFNLYNISGKKVKSIYEGNLSQGKHDIVLNTAYLPQGIYFAELKTTEDTKFLKIFITK